MANSSVTIGVSIAIFWMAYLLTKEDKPPMHSQIERRLKGLKNKAASSSGGKYYNELLISESDYKIPGLRRVLSKLKFTLELKNLLKLADINSKIDEFFLKSLLIGFIVFFILHFFIDQLFAILAGALFCLFPYLQLKVKIKRKTIQFAKQFPEALGLISSALRAGHSLISSFQIVVSEMPDPVSTVFKSVSDDISLGKDTRDALENMSNLIQDSQDLRFFITAVLIQREIGGNLAEILDNLNNTIRERFKLVGQIKAQTAQAKFSGFILAVAPIIIGGIIWVLNPKYMEPLLNTLIGQAALAISITLGAVGFFVIQKVTNIKV